MANNKKAMAKSVANAMSIIWSGAWQNRMAAQDQECSKQYGQERDKW